MELVRAGPPFPYLRWTGPLLSRALQRRGQVSGQRRGDVDRLARSRDAGTRAGRRAGTGAPARGGPACRTPDRRRPDARSPAGARGSGACARSRAARAAACRCGSARSTSKWVIASRGSSVSVETRVRTRRSRPSGASILPRRAGGRPSTSARYSRTSSRAASSAFSAAWTGSERATTSRPDVSRSSRCTMPARSGSAAGHPAGQRLRERAVAVPARRMHDHARRLVDDDQVLVLPGDRERAPGTAAAGASPGGSVHAARARRPRAPGAWPAAAPSTVTCPPSISRCAAAREPAWAARNTSRRSPADSAGTVSSRGIGLGAPSRRSLEHVDRAPARRR